MRKNPCSIFFASCAALAILILGSAASYAQSGTLTPGGSTGGSNSVSASGGGNDFFGSGSTLIISRNDVRIGKYKFKKRVVSISGPNVGPPPTVTVATKNGVFVLDITDPTSPTLVGSAPLPGIPSKVSVNTQSAIPGQTIAAVVYGSSEVVALDQISAMPLPELGHAQVGNICLAICPLGQNYFAAACGPQGICDVWASTAWGVAVDRFHPTSYADGICTTGGKVIVDNLFGTPNFQTFTPIMDQMGITFSPSSSMNLPGSLSDVVPLEPVPIGVGPNVFRRSDGFSLADAPTSPTLRVLVDAGFGGVHIVDVTDTTPTLIKTIAETGTVAISTDGTSVALLSQGSGDLIRYDIHDVANPVKGSSYIGTVDYDTALIGSNLFVAGYGGGGLQAYDTTAPLDPAYLGRLQGGSLRVLDAINSTTLLASGSSGLDVYDVSNPAAPVVRSHTPGANFVNGIAVNGHYAYLAASTVRVYDISDLSHPVAGNAFGAQVPNAAVQDIQVSGNYAFEAIGPPGLGIYDVSDPTSITLVKAVAPPQDLSFFGGFSQQVAIEGNLLCLADGSNGFQLYDISNPTNPVFQGADYTISCAAVAFDGNTLYAADTGNAKLRVYDIQNPTHVALLESDDVTDNPVHIRVVQGKVFVSTAGGGVSIFNVQNATTSWEQYR